jgi:hypothetical protein
MATVVLWALGVALHAAWWFGRIVPSMKPIPDLYANTLGFQVVAYTFRWIAPAVVVLVCTLLVEFAVLGRRPGPSFHPTGSSGLRAPAPAGELKR